VFYDEQASRTGDAGKAAAPQCAPAGAQIIRLPAAPARHESIRPGSTPAQPADQRDGMRDPERQLWCAVIIHTLYEAAGRIAYAERGEHDEVRREAIAWFEDAGEDFHAVCDLAGFLPGAIRDGALRVIRRGRLPRIRISKAG
jgi:hypothetical protein